MYFCYLLISCHTGTSMNIYQRFAKLRAFPVHLILIDLGLLLTACLMFATEHIVLFFHIIFVLLSVGAFFWNFRAFIFRSFFWVGGSSHAVLLAVRYRHTS